MEHAQELVKTQKELFKAQEEVNSLRLQFSDPSGKLLEAEGGEKVAKLSREKEVIQQQLSTSEQEGLRKKVKRVQDKIVQLWHDSCRQLLANNGEILSKGKEI